MQILPAIMTFAANAIENKDTYSVVQDIESGVDHIVSNTDNITLFGIDIDIFNFIFAVLAFIVGVFAAIFDWNGFRASKRTADNVVRVSEDVQIAQFNDLIRHFYRNMICSLGISVRQINWNMHNGYVSETHLLKLKTLPEDIIHLEKYNTDRTLYTRMHEVKLLLRNYDSEIDIALMHFKDRQIRTESMLDDFDNLLFKPFYLISTIVRLEKEVFPKRCFDIESNPLSQAIFIIISEHFNKLADNIDKLADRIIPLATSSIDPKIVKYFDNGFSRLTKMIDDDTKFMDMSDILNENNPFLKESAREFIIRLREGKTNRQTCSFEIPGYMQALSSNNFDVRQMLLFAISADLEIEREKIKFIEFVDTNKKE